MAKDDPKMQYYNAEGKQVAADDESAARQYLSDDPNRPDAPKSRSNVFSTAQINEPDDEEDAEDEEKALDAPAENKARKSSANK